MQQPYKVWDSQHQSMTQYTPRELYKIVVDYPHTNRLLEFIGMDRGSCLLQAEVAKEEGDTLMLMQNEETITVLQKEKV
jgi:uncharacterized protein (UPF0128 family)